MKRSPSPLWRIIQPVRQYTYSAIGLSIVSSALTLGVLASLIHVLSQLLNGQTGYSSSFWWLGVFAVLTLVTRLLAFHLSHLGAFELEMILRRNMLEHLGKLPLGYIHNKGAGALSKIMHLDVKSLHGFVADTAPFYGRALVMPVMTLGFIFWFEWRLALVAIGVLVIGVGFMMLATKDYSAQQKRYMKANENVSAALVEYIQAMPVVRTFDSGSLVFSRLNNALNTFKTFISEWLKLSGNNVPTSSVLLSPLPTLLALTIAGVYYVSAGTSDVPNWVALLLLGTGLAEAIFPLMWLDMFTKLSNASAERILDLLDSPVLSEPTSPQHPKDASICVDNVSFAYEKDGTQVLKNISFTVKEHTVTALVGPSGAGKTTIARLLPRFWDVTEGAIRIGGVDVRDMSQTTLMNTVAFVFQDTFLFQRSIRDNIAMGNPNASQAQIEAAAKAAHAHEFIMALDGGYNAVAGERGANLSGGQRQRITLARAILQDCPVIVLDEATAFADPECEAEIIKALANLTRNKTLLMVAHRLSTITAADQILVFDHGELVQSGTHEELLSKPTRYKTLWDNYQRAQNWSITLSGDAQ